MSLQLSEEGDPGGRQVLGVLGVRGDPLNFGRPSSLRSSRAVAKLSLANAVEGDISGGVSGVEWELLLAGEEGTASRVDFKLRLRECGMTGLITLPV